MKQPLTLYSVIVGPYSFLSLSPDVADVCRTELRRYLALHPDATKADMSAEHTRIIARITNVNWQGLAQVKLT